MKLLPLTHSQAALGGGGPIPLCSLLTCPLPASMWFCISDTAGPPESR